MTDKNQTEGDELDAADAPTPVIEQPVAHYIYEHPFKDVPFAFATDRVARLLPNLPAPKNSTTWEPPVAPEGKQTYFDGAGWFTGPKWDVVLAALPAFVKKHMENKVEHQMKTLSEDYPELETSTWNLQVREARLFIDTGSSAFITTLAKGRDEDPELLALKIVDKNEAYGTNVANLLILANQLSTVDLSKTKSEDLTWALRLFFAQPGV